MKKFDLQNPIIGKIATQVKASNLTDKQLTKKNLMQGEINKLENRLEQLRNRPIRINDDSDDENGGAGGGGVSDDGDDGTPHRPTYLFRRPKPTPKGQYFDELLNRYKQLREGSNNYDALMNRYRKLRYEKSPASPTSLRTSEINRELESLKSKGLAKFRKSDAGLFKPVLPDTLPPTPPSPDYFPPPPVQLLDDSFLTPNKPPIPKKALLDQFSRPLTKIIDPKKNKIEIVPKKENPSINETNSSEQQFFLKLMNSHKKVKQK